MSGIVYCLTNPAMPNYIKIGMTAVLEGRLRQLDNTSVPLLLECVFAVEVENPEEVERLLHRAFDGHRVRHSREFLDCSPQEVSAAMRLTGGRNRPRRHYLLSPDQTRFRI